MGIKDDMEDVQEAVINELITENGITNTLADGQVTETKIANGEVTAAKLDRAYLESTGGSVSGNLLVGKSSVSLGAVGIEVKPFGEVRATADGVQALQLNRLTSNGEIINLRRNGTTVGSITAADTNISISAAGVNNCGWAFLNNSAVSPMKNSALSDNRVDLGSHSHRMDDIYATNGTIKTSDENEKQDIESLSEAEQRVAVAAKGLLRKFRWKDKVAEKGEEARIHFGIIAQDLQAAFEAEGLDAGRYAMFISSTWTDEDTGEEKTRLGVRYSELLAFIISAI